jgi:hypothetical protein
VTAPRERVFESVVTFVLPRVDPMPALRYECSNVVANPGLPYFVALAAQASGQVNKLDREAQDKTAADLRARIEASPKLHFNGVHFAAKPPAIGWESGSVSWIAFDRKGLATFSGDSIRAAGARRSCRDNDWGATI